MNTKNSFHITIGSSGLNVARDVLLIKTALLYGDSVTLCSPGSSLILKQYTLGESNLSERLTFLQYITDDPVVLSNIEIYKYLLKKKHLTRKELLAKRNADRKINVDIINKTFRDRVSDVKRQQRLDEVGVDGIHQAIRQGRLHLELVPYTDDFEAMTDDFIRRLAKDIRENLSYPLFDDLRNKVRQEEFEKHGLTFGIERQSTHVGVASCALERLPSFDLASVAEILEIREELAGPLVRFRGAMTEFTGDVKNAPWEDGFERDVENVYQEKLKPAIAEIEEQVRSSSFLKLFGKNILANAWLVGAAPLTVLVSQPGDLRQMTALALAGAAGGGITAIAKAGGAANRERQKQLKEAQNHEVYFYYEAGNRLSKLGY